MPKLLTDQIYAASGPSITKAARKIKWTAAGDRMEKLNHRWNKLIRQRTDQDKMKDFIERVINDRKAVVTADPIDPTLRQYSTRINNETVTLTVRLDDNGDIDRVYAFQDALAKVPIITENVLNELKRQDWQVQYGTKNDFDSINKVVTIDPSDPDAAIEALFVPTSAILDPERHKKLVDMVEETHKYFLDADPNREYKLTMLPIEPFERGDGFYNAVRRFQAKQLADADTTGVPTTTIDQAVAIPLYRYTHDALNATLREGGQGKNRIKPFVKHIEKELEKFTPYKGQVYRMIGGRGTIFNRFGPIPASIVKASYVDKIGEVIKEPAFLSCTTKDDFLGPYSKGNVKFVIQSERGKELGCLSPYAEILFRSDTLFKVLDIEVYAKKGKQKRTLDEEMRRKHPNVIVYLREVKNKEDAESAEIDIDIDIDIE